MLLLGDSAGAGVFVGIFPVFAGKNLVLIAKSKYNYQVVAHVPQGSKEPLPSASRRNESAPEP
jgi:hypothetical protein